MGESEQGMEGGKKRDMVEVGLERRENGIGEERV